jgi:hypothetical protein
MFGSPPKAIGQQIVDIQATIAVNYVFANEKLQLVVGK